MTTVGEALGWNYFGTIGVGTHDGSQLGEKISASRFLVEAVSSYWKSLEHFWMSFGNPSNRYCIECRPEAESTIFSLPTKPVICNQPFEGFAAVGFGSHRNTSICCYEP